MPCGFAADSIQIDAASGTAAYEREKGKSFAPFSNMHSENRFA
jgi:hypothetical protein